MLKALLFDLDGVLIDSYAAWFGLFNEALVHFGKARITQERFDKDVWAKSSIAYSARAYFDIPERELRAFFGEKNEEFLKALSDNPDARQAIPELRKRGFKLGVVTNSDTSFARDTLEKMGIRREFEFLIGGDRGESKPSPDMLLQAMRHFKLPPSQGGYVGDTATDELAAKNARIPYIGFRRQGDERIERLTELPALAERMRDGK